MKLFYPLTTLAIALTLFAQPSFAQNYSGGTYTAVLPGNWKNNPTPVWQTVPPSPVCNNCLIQISAQGTVVLNTSVMLTGGSKMLISSGATLLIADSAATNMASGNNILMDYTGPANTLDLAGNTSFLNASGASGYNGVLIVTPNGATPNYLKYYGTNPVYFGYNPVVTLNGNAQYGTTQLGAATLSSTGTLPIILSGFGVALKDGAVDLSWSTQLEINSDHFAIERSSNAGARWAVIGTVAAHDNSATVLNYSFSDSKPAAGTSEYRLQMVDKDAKYVYSEVKTIRNGLISAVSIYPNPARDYVNVTVGGSTTLGAVVRLLNQSGQLLLEKNVSHAGGTTVPLAVGTYPQGNYLVVVIGADGSQQVSKLLLSK